MDDLTITIRPTDHLDTMDGVQVRLWKGIDHLGQSVLLLVAAVLVPDISDQRPYDSLTEITPASQMEV
jgi:hypothetical protein